MMAVGSDAPRSPLVLLPHLRQGFHGVAFLAALLAVLSLKADISIGARSKARCRLIHVEASISLPNCLL